MEIMPMVDQTFQTSELGTSRIYPDLCSESAKFGGLLVSRRSEETPELDSGSSTLKNDQQLLQSNTYVPR